MDRFYSIAYDKLFTAMNEKALEYYGNVKPLPEDYEVGKYLVENGALVINPNYEAEKAEKEARRRASFKLTKADFWIACLQLGITKAMVKEKIALIPDETLRAVTEIRLDDAEFFYRGDTGLTTIAGMFGVTDEQLDAIFKVV